MNRVTTEREIDLTGLPFEASQHGTDDGFVVAADVPEADLRAAVDAAPDYVEPVPVVDRVAELERRANAASAAPDLAEVKAKLGGR